MTPPRELRDLGRATATYLDALREAETWAEQTAAAHRIANPGYAYAVDRLRDELMIARRDREMGTPAIIGRVVAELLGEA